MASRTIRSQGFFHFLASIGAPVYVTLAREKRVALPSGRLASRRAFNALYGSFYEYEGVSAFDEYRLTGVRKHPVQWQW